MELIKFSATKLAGTNKKGIIKPDSEGYYTQILGGLNVLNSCGQYYTAEGSKDLFEQSSIFMRRVKSGCLKGELGHPKRLTGMSTDDYVNRLLTIEETNVVCHFGDIWLDLEFGQKHPEYKNSALIAIMGKVKPSGPMGPTLEAAYANGKEDVCFSIRALTRDSYVRGRRIRTLTQILTIDNVTEPGIAIARKYESPALESISDIIVTRSSLENIVNEASGVVTTEDSKANAIEALKLFEGHSRKVIIPVYKNW